MNYKKFISQMDSERLRYYFNNPSINKFMESFDHETAIDYISSYFKCGAKEYLLDVIPKIDGFDWIHERFSTKDSFRNYKDYLPKERAVHTASVFCLGAIVESCINPRKSLDIKCGMDRFSFQYLWFLTALYHDMGYCIAESRNPPLLFLGRIDPPSTSSPASKDAIQHIIGILFELYHKFLCIK